MIGQKKNRNFELGSKDSPAVTELYSEPKIHISANRFHRKRRKMRRKAVLTGTALALLPAFALSLFCFVNREEIIRRAGEARNQAAAERATVLSVAPGKKGEGHAPPFTSLTVFGTDGGDQPSDALEPSGPAHAFAPVETLSFEEEEGADQTPWGHPVVIVEGQVMAVLESQEAYEALRLKLMEPYTKAVAGGKPWKRSFANQVQIYYQADSSGIVSIEEAYDILSPVVSVRLREQIYKERELPFATLRMDDKTKVQETVRLEFVPQAGQLPEEHYVDNVD